MKIRSHFSEQDIRNTINTYGDTVYKVAFSYCKNHADAEDIYQDVFVKYFQHPAPFESNIHEKAWLIRVTINCSKSFLRSNWHKKVILLKEYQDETTNMEHNTDLLSIVLELPIRYREVIHLYYYEGYSTKEIALLLSRKETTIRTQLQRGRELLKSKLKEDFSYE